MAKFQSKGSVSAKKSLATEMRQALMTGVSYMLPLVIAGAVIMGCSRIGASFFGVANIWDASYALSDNSLLRLFHSFDKIGGIGLGLMLPVIAGYIAYGIASKPALAPGLIAGALAQQLGTGFLGALVAGLLAGYIVRFLVTKIKLPGSMASIVPIFIIPFGGTLLTCLIVLYVLGDPLAALNKGLENWLQMMSGTNKVLLAAVVGAMVGFDLGGPVNKAAVTTSMALLASGIYDPNTAAQVAIIVPPIGLGIAAIIWRERFTGALHEAGKASLLMGLVGVSEGAIPFIMAQPKLIFVNVVGAAVAAAMAVGLGAVNKAPISGFYGWLAVEGWFVYVLSIAVGSLIIVLGCLLFVKPTSGIENEASSPV
jgi:fructose PTS system EIIBC or EIIC component